jgi:hypothetical protein
MSVRGVIIATRMHFLPAVDNHTAERSRGIEPVWFRLVKRMTR